MAGGNIMKKVILLGIAFGVKDDEGKVLNMEEW